MIPTIITNGSNSSISKLGASKRNIKTKSKSKVDRSGGTVTRSMTRFVEEEHKSDIIGKVIHNGDILSYIAEIANSPELLRVAKSKRNNGLSAQLLLISKVQKHRFENKKAKGTTLMYNSGLSCCAFSPNNRFVITCGFTEDILWDVQTGAKVWVELGMKEGMGMSTCCTYSPDGTRILFGGVNGKIIIRDAMNGEKITELKSLKSRYTRGVVGCCAWSSSGKYIVTASYGKPPILWNARTGTFVSLFRYPCVNLVRNKFTVLSCEFSLDESYILMTIETLYPIKLRTVFYKFIIVDNKISYTEDEYTFDEYRDDVRSAKFSPDGSQIAIAGTSGIVRILNAENLDEFAIDEFPIKDVYNKYVKINYDRITSRSFSPDGKLISVINQSTSTIEIWNIQFQRLHKRINTVEGDKLTSCEFSSDGKRILCAYTGADTAIIIDV
jgi:WD40 repeat protein